ncbi:sulfite exporter TauE/SafE family protein [Paenibacillus sp. V4I5]|uniref:sulfite exporter TauE/SafE family protein n=1 Tax=Paenibacillus sp. V4I5 TaxID=3042306 RepID=UPI00278F9FA0|nr:sulfite exporter TauE/SafE family protein [Paenibacillus sp. V4I5]MDQ0920200.1 putative membrane protein YfcA [Paenibacillus sp. V4I5]
MSFALILIGFTGGILTGLMSVGGGLILTFLLLLIPPIFGQEYSMHMIAGMVIVQTLFSSSSGLVTYWRSRLIDRFLIRNMGPPSLIGGALGSALSEQMSNELLTAIFAILALFATAFMFMRRVEENSTPYRSRTWAICLGLGIGLLGGMFGLGAGFLYLPVMMNIFKIESRTAVGTGLAVGLLLVFGALIGKTVGTAGTEFPWFDGLILAIGAIPGGLIGSRRGKRMKSKSLHSIMAVAIIIVSIKIWADLLHIYGLVPKF